MHSSFTAAALSLAERLTGDAVPSNNEDREGQGENQQREAVSTAARPKRVVLLACFITFAVLLIYILNILTSFLLKISENEKFISKMVGSLARADASPYQNVTVL